MDECWSEAHQFSRNTTAKISFFVRPSVSIFAPLKFVAYIMAILVLALSCLPCADGAAVTGTTKTELIANSDHRDDDHEDACSPFCQCACCAGLSISHLIPGNTYKINDYDRTYTSFSHSEIIEISLPIWQPPQLA